MILSNLSCIFFSFCVCVCGGGGGWWCCLGGCVKYSFKLQKLLHQTMQIEVSNQLLSTCESTLQTCAFIPIAQQFFLKMRLKVHIPDHVLYVVALASILAQQPGNNDAFTKIKFNKRKMKHRGGEGRQSITNPNIFFDRFIIWIQLQG